MVFSFAETTVLVEGRSGAKHLPAIFALDLCTAVCVHTLVAAQVRELSVSLVAYLTCRAEMYIEHISMEKQQHTYKHYVTYRREVLLEQ